MSWKVIGRSATGTAHTARGTGCEDASAYMVTDYKISGEKIFIGCVSDGAGCAKYASWASALTVDYTKKIAETYAAMGRDIMSEEMIYQIAQDIYTHLELAAKDKEVEIAEYSCTWLGCLLTDTRSVFFQVGDGAIVRNDGTGFFVPVWWPENGEYQNTTSFITDDPNFANLKVLVLDEPVNEVALFTDGLQMLALNTEAQNVHQPFFTGMFTHLAKADDDEKVHLLNDKLAEYLNSKIINDRTDDDKTLVLASRMAI